jgi:hypothetical protein
MDKTEKPRRNQDTSHATRANVLRKWRRWAEELRSAGWSVEEPPETTEEITEQTEERRSTPNVRFLYSGDGAERR